MNDETFWGACFLIAFIILVLVISYYCPPQVDSLEDWGW